MPASKIVVEDGSNNVAIGAPVTATAFSGSGASLTGVDVLNVRLQLGGNLDLNGNDIVTTSNADLGIAPNGTGHVTVKGNDNQGAIQFFNIENNSHGPDSKAAPHSESASNTLTLPKHRW